MKFADLVFKDHPSQPKGAPHHLHAIVDLPNGRRISVTSGGFNYGEPGKPYELMDGDGYLHYPLDDNEVTSILEADVAKSGSPQPPADE